MARPERNSVDYFPFYCDEGKKMFYIEETYGNDGFAVFVKILRELAKTEYHYLNLQNTTTLMFLSAKCKVNVDRLNAIINDLTSLGKFDKQLWEENKIIWCNDFVESIQDAYKKRNNKCITLDGLRILLTGLGILKPSKSTSKGPVNPQSIEEEIKEKESKENKKTKLPPTIEAVESFFFENGYTKESGKKAYLYYSEGDWTDSKGNKVINWKQKMRSVWFKPENEIGSTPVHKLTQSQYHELNSLNCARRDVKLPELTPDQFLNRGAK